MSSEHPSFHEDFSHPVWGSLNWIIKQKSLQKRWGYTADKDLGSGVEIQYVAKYDLKDGNSHTMVLTSTDLVRRETTGSNTLSYKTETGDYNSTIDNITGAVVTAKAGTTWSTDGVAADDMFILDDDHSALIEPDANWGTIQSVDSETQITLTANYSGTTGTWTGSEKNALIRKVYSSPTDERWSWAVVDDKFCFTNGNSDVQYWDGGSGYAGALDSTNAKKARYCVEYANRLVLADVEISGVRDPLSFKWSDEGDPTAWTGSSSGSIQLLESKDWITGLGKVGANIVIYKKDSYVMYHRTGDATDPFHRDIYRGGIGCVAPYSLVEFKGVNAFLWRDNFYVFDGSMHIPIGDKIKDKFFDLVGETEVERVFGFNNPITSEVLWRANTSEGAYWFVWNYGDLRDYPDGYWTVNDYADNIFCGGKGAI